jgi:2-polyprenyl-3-methyl-5-hydroxy-6-metoxy-1,4-benzoquinol methylase
MNWHGLDHLRDFMYWYGNDYREEGEYIGFKVCKECGFVTYDYIAEERLSEFYSKERKIVGHINIITCNRKNGYHKKFFNDIWDIKKNIKEDANLLDVGCAQGSFLDFLRSEYGYKNVYGTEYNEPFRAYAKYEYEIEMTKDIDMTKKYDFISYYHVLEHMQHPLKVLETAKKVLNPEGVFFISVPLFFEVTDETSGAITNEFEELYHLNHVNVFTRKSFYNLLKKAGLKIIAEDNFIYGCTVICTNDNNAIKELEKDNYKEIEEKLKKQKIAIDLLKEKQYEKAIETDPTYIDAYMHLSVNKENMKEFDKAWEVLDQGEKLVPPYWRSKFALQKAKLLFQWDENKGKEEVYYSNHIKKAEKLFLEILNKYKPESEEALYFLAIIHGKYKKEYEKAIEYVKRTYRVNPSKFAEAFNLIGYFHKERFKEEGFK